MNSPSPSRPLSPLGKTILHLTLAAVSACTVLHAQVTPLPGCKTSPASPATGTDIPETYFGPSASTVQKELLGPLQLLTAGKLDSRAGTIVLPLYRGRVLSTNQTVWYILTDTTDRDNAAALGLNFSAKLAYSAVSQRAVRTANLLKDGTLEFNAGTVDFSPDRLVTPAQAPRPFPPLEFRPGSVGDASYSPLVRILNAGGHIYNAPIVAVGDNVADFMVSGSPNYKLVHDKVVSLSIDPLKPRASTVTLNLTPGFSFAKPVLYLSMEASAGLPAALEGATFAAGLQDILLGTDDSVFSAVERLFLTLNGPTGCDNPQRQGLYSALTEGRPPFNVLGGIPTVSTDYSPMWDVNMGEWTQAAIDKGWRSRVIDEFQILALVEAGAITAPGGGKYGSSGFIVNCPIVFRFL